jgi:hypothetical protein
MIEKLLIVLKVVYSIIAICHNRDYVRITFICEYQYEEQNLWCIR